MAPRSKIGMGSKAIVRSVRPGGGGSVSSPPLGPKKKPALATHGRRGLAVCAWDAPLAIYVVGHYVTVCVDMCIDMCVDMCADMRVWTHILFCKICHFGDTHRHALLNMRIDTHGCVRSCMLRTCAASIDLDCCSRNAASHAW